MHFWKHNRVITALFIGLLLTGSNLLLAANVEVIVEGIDGTVQKNVLQSMSIYQERERAETSSASIHRLHERAPGEIRTALQPFGYYRPQIRARLNQNGARWTAQYDIEPGPAIRVASVDIRVIGEGGDDSEFRKLIDEFPLRADDPLQHALYEKAKNSFQRLAAERGYFDQHFTRHEISIDMDAYRAHIYLHVDTGRRYRFGKINIEQNLLNPELVAKYVRISPSQPYSAAALLELQATLSATDYFGTIDVVADPLQANDYAIPVYIRLAPRKPNKYTFGFGYGTDTGPRGQLGWERRYLNEDGHHVRAELRGSQIDRSASAGYFIPIRNPRTDQLAVTAGYTETDIQNTDTQLRHITLSRTTIRGHLQETFSLSQQKEKFSIGSQTGDSDLLIPGVAWSYLWGSERLYVRRGARASFDLRGASDQFASDTSFSQIRFQSKGIYSIFGSNRFVARIETGATHVDDFDALPPSLRFYAGGDTSVRGYDFNSLGPINSEGVVIGGKYLLVGSVEYEQHVIGNWGAAIFYDVGNALSKFTEPLKKGAGVGIRWRSPIGQIRLDVASALSDADRPWRVHLYIGPDL